MLAKGWKSFLTISFPRLYQSPFVDSQSLLKLSMTSLKTNSPSYLQMTLIFFCCKQRWGSFIGRTPPTIWGIFRWLTDSRSKVVSFNVSSTVENKSRSGFTEITFFTKSIMTELRLYGGQDVLYGKIKQFLRNKLFT